MNIRNSFRLCFAITAIATLLTTCSSGNPVINETWSLVDLISQGEQISAATEIVEVRNCGTTERKTTECSAGTNNDLTVSLEGGVQFGGGVVGSINASVANELGMGRNSGESLTLDTPAEGFIGIYTVDKVYRVVTGEMLVRSSTGRETKGNYTFHASCSLTIVNVETVSCGTGATETPGVTEPPLSPEDPYNCNFINELVNKGQINQILVGGKGPAGVQILLTESVDVPLGWTVHREGVEYKGPVHFDAGTLASFWTPDPCEPLSINP